MYWHQTAGQLAGRASTTARHLGSVVTDVVALNAGIENNIYFKIRVFAQIISLNVKTRQERRSENKVKDGVFSSKINF